MINRKETVTVSAEVEFLEGEIRTSISTLKNKVKCNKRKAALINVLSVSLGALITFILGVDIATEDAQIQKNLALILGTVLTIVNGWSALFNYKKLWARQKSTLLDLYQIQNEIGFRKAAQENCSVVDLFEKYQRVWEKDGNEWRSIIHSATKEPKHQAIKAVK